ncbi:MAG: glycosyltransferase family 4 protein [Phycisphaeraceae bacterium]|nr:glycosyltransferase family 4 protein [Phycisphaeraceae bacterium]
MRIIHIITRLILGGAQENTLITCRLLAERGHEVILITGPAVGPEGELFTHTVGKGYKTYVINELRREISPLRDCIAYNKLKALIQGFKPDIVHTHSAKAGILGRKAAYRSSWRKRPSIVHGVHGLSFHPYQPRLLNTLYILLERKAAKWTDHFVTVADAMTTQSKAVGIGVNKPYTTAYSAIDEAAFVRDIPALEKQAFREEHNIPEDAVVLVTVARLFMLKGHDTIIESAKTLAKQHPNVIWLFVGNGKLARYYWKQIQEAGLSDHFRFTGLLQPDQIPLAIQASDILVHCSLREGLARTLPQAMLCSRPAISFDVDGAREVVNDQTGRLIEPKNIEQLIQACSELIQDGKLRDTLGKNGLALVREKFAPNTMVDTIEDVYRSIEARG